MRRLLVFLVALTGLVGAAWLAWQDPGYVVAGRGTWSLETSLPVFGLLTLFGFGLFYFVARLLGGLYRLPEWWQRRGATRRGNRARKALDQGAAALIEGRWKDAEQWFTKTAPETLHWLGAAWAANARGQFQTRDEYLQQSHASADLALAVHLLHTRLASGERQWNDAEQAVGQAYALSPKHPEVLRLLAEVLRGKQDWAKLAEWLPEITRRKALDAEAMTALENETYQGVMEQAIVQGPDAAAQAWKKLPKPIRQRAPVVAGYGRYLHRAGQDKLAEPLVREALKQQWDGPLARLFGELEGDSDEQLMLAENWLKKHPSDPDLLHALGSLSQRARMMGKAQEYYQQSLHFQAHPETHLALGDLLEQLGDTRQAAQQFRQAVAAAR